MTDYDYDFFISHASEDKDGFVRNLADQLSREGFSVWFDEFALEVGDDLGASIDEGLKTSRFGIVVLSHAFFEKNWPKRELEGLIAREIAGEKVILPIWHDVDVEHVRNFSPTLANKVALRSTLSLPKIVTELAKPLPDTERDRLPYRKLFGDLLTHSHRAFTTRLRLNADIKTAIARHFWDSFLPQIVAEQPTPRMFFDSGSTVAYFAKVFTDYLSDPWIVERKRSWHVTTNNLLVAQAIIPIEGHTGIAVDVLAGEIDYKYLSIIDLPGQLKLSPVSTTEYQSLQPVMKTTVKQTAERLQLGPASIACLSTSGWDAERTASRGPTVGSFAFKVFKNAVLCAADRVVFFLDADKFFLEPSLRSRHPLFDSHQDWARACKTRAMAVCIGARTREQRDTVLAQLHADGFVPYGTAKEYDGCFSVFVKTAAFPGFYGDG